MLKPEEIPVPEKKFQEAFGLSWKDALDQKVVYNAIDACKYLGECASCECDISTKIINCSLWLFCSSSVAFADHVILFSQQVWMRMVWTLCGVNARK